MSMEAELLNWLNRPDKTFQENLQFANKVWISAELILNNKCNIIIKWFNEKGHKDSKKLCKAIPYNEIMALFYLPAQPGSIAIESKKNFIKFFILLIENNEKREISLENRKDNVKLLARLIEVEWLQDLLRTDYELTACVYGQLFQSYCHLLKYKANNNVAVLTDEEIHYFTSVLKIFKDYIKRIGNMSIWEKPYDVHIAQPLIEVMLYLNQKFNMNYFEDLKLIENQLRNDRSIEELVDHLFQLPVMHVRLFTLEAAIARWQKDDMFLEKLLNSLFLYLNNVRKAERRESLLFCAFIFDVLCAHDVHLNLIITQSEKEKATIWVGKQIFALVERYRSKHLHEVLTLLNAVLRLNPLILEQNAFQITAWMIVAPKACNPANNEDKQSLFETFLNLVLDMFRRLSRTEKLVTNLLKSLKLCLANSPLPASISELSDNNAEISDEAEPARKRKRTESEVMPETSFNCHFFEQYFKKFFQKNVNSEEKTSMTLQSFNIVGERNFPHLRSTWPWASVGRAFSQLITGLVIKPSLVVWKTLLYALKDSLESLNGMKTEQKDVNENAIFELDLISALLCQYFAGLKVPEQYEKHAKEITDLRTLTKTLLKTFGNFVSTQKVYQNRTMHAFLECVYYVSNYEMLLTYYIADGTMDENLDSGIVIKQMHDFLSEDEWRAIEKIISRFGTLQCRYFFKRLLMQRQQAFTLLSSSNTDDRKDNSILPFADDDTNDNKNILEKHLLYGYKPNGCWLLKTLDRARKLSFIKALFNNETNKIDYNILTPIADDLESLELIAYVIVENIYNILKMNGKPLLCTKMNCDFNELYKCQADDHKTYDQIIKSLAMVINDNVTTVSTKKINKDEISNLITILSQLPLGFLRRQTKTILFTMFLTLYYDINAAKLEKLQQQIFKLIIDLLHFGQRISVFKYFNTTTIFHMLPPTECCWAFYELLFTTIKNEDKGNESFLIALTEHLQQNLLNDNDGNHDDDNDAKNRLSTDAGNLKLMIIALETLSNLHGLHGKRMLKYLHGIMDQFAAYIKGYFRDVAVVAVEEAEQRRKEDDRRFVEKTIAGYVPYALTLLNANKKENDKKLKTENEENNGIDDEAKDENPKNESNKLDCCIDEEFRRICKIYLGHSINYRNPHAIHLMQVALNHRKQLHLDQDEIEFVLSSYWRQLNEDLRATQEKSEALQLISTKTTESVVKMIIGNKTNEDLLLTLKDIDLMLSDSKNFPIVLYLLNLIAKSSFSTIKGAIFNEQFKQIVCNIAMCLSKNEHQQYNNIETVLSLLSCQQALAENKTIPLSPDALDNILQFLIDINIKKFEKNDDNTNIFFKLHLAMIQLCSTLIKFRQILLMDRIPQFMHIFKDLLQAVVQYKSERQKDVGLTGAEVDDLADLGHKLEILMHIIATHRVDVKRVAPFVLTFVINLMVSNKRPTTLYPKIKNHMEAICHSLIGVCDHRVGRFILRCSNEAGRQLYELLVKDHKKYHKFKGKI